jgi:hypothetical protein
MIKKYLIKMKSMKMIIISMILIMAFAFNSVFASGKINKISKKNNKEISLKYKSHPYSFLKKICKPNPVT